MLQQSWRKRLLCWWGRLRLEQTALLEVGVLFLPGIPAVIWLWPRVQGVDQEIAQALVYCYFLAGSLYIGLRRWKPGELGLNMQGIVFSLVCGGAILLGRSLVIWSVDWGAGPPEIALPRFLWEVFYYFILVGLCEELLFRGLFYRALENYLGVRWAIGGSIVGFALWHIFGQGPLVAATMLFYGLIFALIRWRAGGIVGLVIVHGLIDLTASLMLPTLDVTSLGRPEIPYPGMLLSGLALLLAAPVYAWLVNPKRGPKK